MDNRKLYFRRFDAHQVALAIGIFQTVSMTLTYLGVGLLAYYFMDLKPTADYEMINSCMAVFTGAYVIVLVVFPLSLAIGAFKGIRWLLLPSLILGWMSVFFTGFAIVYKLFYLASGSASQIYGICFDAVYTGAASYCLMAVTESFKDLGVVGASRSVCYKRRHTKPGERGGNAEENML